jgi:putative redox protein
VKLSAERAATDPKVFTKVHMHFVVRGRALKRNLVEQAIRLSHEKYCSASTILAKTATMTHAVEIIEASPGNSRH